MDKKVLIVQRFYYNFREGFFDYLYDIDFKFRLICATKSRGKVKVHDDVGKHSFILKVFFFFIGDKYVVFPFLFFRLIWQNPRTIITEGGANTINNLAIFLYCKIFRRKYIIWDLGKGFSDFGNSTVRNLYMRFYNYLLKHSYLIYGYNTLSKEYFKSIGIDENKIVVLNNTIDTRKIKKIKSAGAPTFPEELKEQSESEYTFLLFVGALAKSKNIEALVDLMKMLGKGYFLILVGDGPKAYREELESLFAATNHCFVGYKKNEQLLPYYNLASLAVLPGLGGLSINQAMAFGVPVVCRSADGAEKDLVLKDETGYIFSNNEDAYKYITSKSKTDWDLMGRKAESFLYANHSVESMMDKFILYL
jgi:glycosyltransferase involved in cell wall biosynthesis